MRHYEMGFFEDLFPESVQTTASALATMAKIEAEIAAKKAAEALEAKAKALTAAALAKKTEAAARDQVSKEFAATKNAATSTAILLAGVGIAAWLIFR